MARLGEARRGRGGEGWPVGSGCKLGMPMTMRQRCTARRSRSSACCGRSSTTAFAVHGAVYEPFAGSGTTIIAAEKSGRRCFGMEIDPRYCDVIVSLGENLAIGGLFTLASPAGVRLPAGGGHDLGDGRPLRTAQHVDQQRLLGALARAPGGLTWLARLAQDGVYIETRMGFDVDGVEIKARLDFGAKAIDWRGLFKNAGIAP